MGSDFPTTTNFGSDIEPDSDSSLASVAYYARQNCIGRKNRMVDDDDKDSMDDQESVFSFAD